MAQVNIKKLQTGGNTPTRGMLTVDGQDYTLEEVNNAISALSPEEQQYMAGLSKALSAGNNWSASSYDNTFNGAGVNDWMSSIFGSKERADRKLGKTSNLVKTVDATFGNRRDSVRRAASRFFLNLRHNSPVTSSEDENTDLSELLRGSGWFDTDKEGKYINHASNSRKMQIFDDIVSHFLNPSEEERKKKTHNTWGEDYDTITNWISGNPGAADYFNNLKNRILAGGKDLDDTDLDLLKLFGFDPTRGEKTGDPNGVGEFKRKFGISDDDFNKYFGVDANGNILPNQYFYDILGDDVQAGGNYWFNDAFRSNRGWENTVLPWLNNLWLVNGKLYKGDDQELLNTLNVNGFTNRNKLGDYTGSNALVNWLWGQETPSAYDKIWYSDFLDKLNGRYFTQRFHSPYIEGVENEDNIVKYYDFNDAVDQYGLRPVHAAVLDEFGNVVRELNPEEIALLEPSLDENKNPIGLNLYERSTTDNSNTLYYNAYKKYITDDQGNPWMTVHVGKDSVMLDVPVGEDNTNSVTRHLGANESIKLPKDVWNRFGTVENFWNNLGKNRDLREKFFNTLEVIIGNANRGDRFVFDRTRVLNQKEWQELGVSAEDAEALVTWIKEQNEGATTGAGGWFKSIIRSTLPGGFGIGAQNPRKSEERHERNTTKRVTSEKLGGWLPKMQQGGLFGATNVEIKKQAPVKVNNFENSSNSKDLLNSSEHWTDSDRLDLASTVVDLASMAATFLPGAGNIAGGVGGAAADLMRFSANVERDGMDLGDWGNLGIGLGMDALTLLPVVGTGAKAAKLVKTLSKVGRPLSKAFMAVGAIEAADAVTNVIKNGKFTVEDARKLAMGAQALMGTIHIRKGANAEAELANAINRLVKTEGQEVKTAIKIGNKEVKLEGNVLKRLSGKKTEEAAKELKSILKEQNSGLGDDDFTNITDSSLLERFGFNITHGRISKLQNPLKERAVLPKEKVAKEGDITGREISWKGNPNHKWANGKVQRVDEFIDENLANAAIRKGLAEQGWFGNTGTISNYARRYFGNRLMAIEPGEDFKVNIKKAPVYKGRDVENIYTEQPKEVKLLPPAPTPEPTPTPVVEPVIEPTVEVVNNPVLPALPEAIRPKVIAAPKGPRGFINPSRTVKALPQQGGQRTDLPSIQKVLGFKEQQLLDPNNFGEVLQKLVYTPKFRQLAKTNPVAARQLFEQMKFNYIMHGTTGTPLTRGKEFDEMAEALKAFNGLFFKKGGKILKGEKGLPSNTAELLANAELEKWRQQMLGEIENNIENDFAKEYKIIPPEIKQDVDPVVEQPVKNENESVSMGRAGKGVPFNMADTFDAMRALESAKGLNKQYNFLSQANRARSLQQFNVPRLEVPKIYTGREKYTADNAAGNMMLESTPDFTADSKLAMVSRLQRNAQAESMRQQGRLAETEAITKQNAANTEIENKNRQMEAEAANKRSELLADIESKDYGLKANKQQILSTRIVDPLLQQYGQQIRDEQNKLDALFQESEISNKQRLATDEMYKRLRNNSLYNVWQKSDDYKYDSTQNGYLNWLNTNHNDVYKTVKDTVWNQYRIPYLRYDIAKGNRRYPWTSLINPQQAE